MDSSALVAHTYLGNHNPSQYSIKLWLHTGTTVTRIKGLVKYGVIMRDHPCLLDLTSGFISSREGVEFEASWLLIARWVDICPFPVFNCMEVNK